MRAKTPRGRSAHPEPPLIRNWRHFLPYLGGIAALLLFAAALVILHSHAQAYRPSEVRRALRTLQAWQPFAALGLAAASYLLLTLYDVLALRHIGRTLPYHRVALASFTGYAFSHTLGFGSLIGPSIRYRIYTPMGLTAGEVAETSAFVIVTFMTGLVAVFPLVALLDPSSLDARNIAACGYRDRDAWVAVDGGLRRIRLVDRAADPIVRLPAPPSATAAGAQIALSVADLSLVAAVLYACLPHASAVGYPHVLAVYVLAFVAGLISHVPGGLGVFDAVVLVGLSARLPADQILAGLLAFRVIYQLVPLVGAGVLFGAVEALAARRVFAQAVANISIWAGAVGPTVLAGCTFAGGGVLLFSNAMPVSDARLRLVETVLPLTVVETSHFIGSVDGVLLLLFAYGIQQRLRWAWALSAMLLCAGAVSMMLKGFAYGKRPSRSCCSSLPCCRHDESSTSRAHHLLSNTHLAGWSRSPLCSPPRSGSACFRTSTSTTRNGGVSRFTTMPRVSYELRSLLRLSWLVQRPIACSARCGIDPRLFAAERGSSGSARQSSGDDRYEPLQSRPLVPAFSH
jgi:phosphatidylglycerol lysyltransferase